MNIFFTQKRCFITKDLNVLKGYTNTKGNFIPSSFNVENNFYFTDYIKNDNNMFCIQNSEGKYITLGEILNEKLNYSYDLSLSDNDRLIFTLVDGIYLIVYLKDIQYCLSVYHNMIVLEKFTKRDYYDKNEILLVEDDEYKEDKKDNKEIHNSNYVDIIDSLPFVTPVTNLQNIINSKMLYNNIDRIKHGIYPESGHGDANEFKHHLCDACTNFDLYPNLRRKCKDSIGITLGVLAYGNIKIGRFDRDDEYSHVDKNCCLYFSSDLLRSRYYHVTTDDNLGFYIHNKATYKIYKEDSEFKPKYLISFNESEIKNMTPEIYFETYEDMEILVKESISLEYLTHISFGSSKDYEYFKDQLDSLDITSSILN